MMDWRTLLPQGVRGVMTSEEYDAKRPARYFEEQQVEFKLVSPAPASHANSTRDERSPSVGMPTNGKAALAVIPRKQVPKPSLKAKAPLQNNAFEAVKLITID